jgi:uncharacterized protein YbjT (DUF2867 family)
MILVTGATGNVGRAVLTQLIAAGEPVRAFSRRPAALPAAVQAYAGDLSTGDGLAAALDGVAGVFLFLDATRLPTGAAGPAAQLIAAHGRPHVVALSSASAGGDPGNLIAAGHLAAEAALADAGLEATVLRPGEFMSNALSWADAIRAGEPVRVPFLDRPDAPVDPADIAAVAVAALRSDVHQGRIIPVSGGEWTTPRERIATLGTILDRPLETEEIPEAEYVAQMAAYMPPVVVEAVLDLLRQGHERGGTAADWVWPAVPDITGRPAHTFAEWAAANRSAFT